MDTEYAKIDYAIEQYIDYGNNELLLEYIESQDEIIYRYDGFRSFIVKVLKNEIKGEVGKGKKNKKIEKRNKNILQYLYQLKSEGIPIKSESKIQEDAIAKAAKEFNVSTATVYRTVWLKHNPNSIQTKCIIAMLEFNKFWV